MIFTHNSDLCCVSPGLIRIYIYIYEQVSTKALWYLCRHFFLTYSLVYITQPVFLPFLNASSAHKWKKTKTYKSKYRAGNIMQWFCRAIKLCIISVMIYPAIMVKNEWGKKKSFTGHLGDFFFAMQVIGNEQFFKVGLIIIFVYLEPSCFHFCH